ncbi:MAG TPA: aromatic ring-hydroxylating dioxygenase subunit alpha [Baekduia sp.]|nr:aromatic ring-hydroxylating dioxygenase subunit alpha [Baekduia sp.]
MTQQQVDLPQPVSFRSLERPYYTSPEIFDTELDRVVARQWILFGHVSEVAEPRDVLVRLMGVESVIVTRDNEGELHAFFNVCRHRGSQICDLGKMQAKRLVCPYHQWTYSLNGNLAGAPHMRDGEGINYSELGLRPVHLEVWQGFIFVALGEEPPSQTVADGVRGAEEHVEVHELEYLAHAHQISYDVDCNWKLLIENFLECYHCPGSHPELCSVMLPITDDMTAFEGIDAALAPTGFNFGAVPLPDGVVSQTMTGQAASKRPLGRVADQAELPATVGIVLNPMMSAIQVFPDYVVTHRMMPTAVDRTVLLCDWFVHPEAQEGVDYQLEDLIALWHRTNEQDIELSERNQRGVNSRAYIPGPNHVRREPAIHGTLELYKELMNAGG